MRKSSLSKVLVGGSSILMVLLLWEILGRFQVYDVALLPPPSRVATALVNLSNEGILWTDVGITVSRVLAGFALGGTLGFLAGVVTGLSARLRRVFEPIIQIARPIPAVALVPLAIVWFGIGETQKFFIVSWASFFPLWVNTHSGVGRVPRELLWAAETLGAHGNRIVREVIVPWSLPFVYAGVRIALALAFTAAVVAEMSGASSGLGFRIIASHLVFRVDRMIASILMIGALGALFDRILVLSTRKLLPWLEPARTGAASR